MDLQLKYGKETLQIKVPDKNILGILQVKNELQPLSNSKNRINESFELPIDSQPLKTITKKRKSATIIVDDNTRSTPTRSMVEPLVNKLNHYGIANEHITVIFGSGTHRPVKPDEAKMILGPEIYESVYNLSHDCKNAEMKTFGKTTFGTNVAINKLYTDAEVKILTGDIGFHYYAGFGGGRKSILPGIAADHTINQNHAMLIDPKATTGNLEGNPVHLDMVEATRKVKPDFMINVVQNTKKEICNVFAGDVETAFNQGVQLYSDTYKMSVNRPADIVLVSGGGYPSDVNLYQAHKAIDNAYRVVRQGGVIIATLECAEGIGHKVFEDWMEKYPTLKQAEQQVKTDFKMGGHKAYYLLKTLKHSNIILVSSLKAKMVEKKYQMTPAKTLEEGLEIGFNEVGRNGRMWVFPSGSSILPCLS